MSSAGASHSGARAALIALWAASFAMLPALARAQAVPAAANSPIVVPPGATVPPAPGTDAPEVHVAAGPDGSLLATPPPASDATLPPTTTEIPPVVPLQTQDNPPAAPGAAAPDLSNSSADLYNYQAQQPPAEVQEQLQSLQQFLEEGDSSTTIGMVVREAHRKVDGGGEVPGLLIVSVMPGSPAAAAGLKGMRTGAHALLEGAAVAASLFFPPAIMAVALVDGSGIGESSDMIIGIDSVRVTNFLDFTDRMRQEQPGDIIYLSVIRNGRRMQVRVKVPGTPATTPPSVSTASAASGAIGTTATSRTP
ncbi:MAG TPA: PDZ domain-containing protein [Candidatus Binataceae bacterium]|nr:PDZ domain-containing protein [Candidatus Binataceae bacterium]